jgi:membrane protein YqaA with SNARE-associated domain
MTEIGALWALFITAFASATILPLPSEGALIAFERAFPESVKLAVVVATFGNTLGGFTTYLLGQFSGRYLPRRYSLAPHVLRAFERFGSATLVFSWLPFFGDLLCGLAGMIRLSWWRCVFWMAIGKCARYAAFLSAI